MVYRFLITSCFLLISSITIGQITITSANMPKDGDTIRYSIVANPMGFDFQETGAAKSWDFTSLEHSSQGVYEYVQSSKTPYLLSFGFTSIGLKIADTLGVSPLQFQNVYAFYKNSSNSFEIVGTGFQYAALPLPQSGKHSDPDEVFTFPLEYADSTETTFDVKVDLKAGFLTVGTYFQSGTRTTVVDGYGKISTPYAKDVECIRVRSEINSFDSVAVTTPAVNFGLSNRRIEYRWLSKTERIPMLEVTGTEVGGNFVANSVRYRDTYRGTEEPEPLISDFSIRKDEDKRLGTFVNTSQGFYNQAEWTISPSTISYNYGDKNSDSIVVEFLAPGEYEVSLAISNPFFQDTTAQMVNFSDPSSVGSIHSQEGSIFPNPAKDVLYIHPNFGRILRAEFWSMDGQLMHNEDSVESDRIVIKDIAPGIYVLVLYTQNKTTFQRVLIE